jgi:hypothetical protein
MKDAAFAKKLIDTAARYFDGDESLEIGCGICFATRDFPGRYSYDVMKQIMNALGDHDQQDNRCYGPYSKIREDWEPRAWMCLFLAAYLTEEEEIASEPEVVEAEPVAKIKMYERTPNRRYVSELGTLVMERQNHGKERWELKKALSGQVLSTDPYRCKIAEAFNLKLVDM